MNIEKIVRNTIIFISIILLFCLGIGTFFNVPILKSIGMLLGTVVTIIWSVAMFTLLFFIIKSSMHNKK
jgi:hypothetical protein